MGMAYKDVNITLSNFVFVGCVAFIQAFGHENSSNIASAQETSILNFGLNYEEFTTENEGELSGSHVSRTD